MSTAAKLRLVSVDDYLAGELVSPVKHEYVGGIVHAMSGGRNAHNIICGNIFAALHQRLRGKICRPFNSDTKIRVTLPTQVRFYYPDVSVVCQANAQAESYQDAPAVIVEVMSKGTRRIDIGEKKDAYLTISSLTSYLLFEQESIQVTVYRRTEQGFVAEVYQGRDSVVPLPEIGTELPLLEAFDRVELVPDSNDDRE